VSSLRKSVFSLLSSNRTYLFSVQIGMPLANALNSIGYNDTILFITIGKWGIYHHKSLGKLAADFYPGDQ
jgi:hypothetical protein